MKRTLEESQVYKMSSYTQVVNNLLRTSLTPDQYTQTIEWLNRQDDRNAKPLFDLLSSQGINVGSQTSTFRYQFPPSKEKVLKTIFSKAVEADKSLLFSEAEKKEGKSAYPTWKRICKITVPELMVSFFKNRFTQVVICVATFALGLLAGALAGRFVYNLWGGLVDTSNQTLLSLMGGSIAAVGIFPVGKFLELSLFIFQNISLVSAFFENIKQSGEFEDYQASYNQAYMLWQREIKIGGNQEVDVAIDRATKDRLGTFPAQPALV